MIIILSNGGEEQRVEVPMGADCGHVRSLTEALEDVGAPSSFTLAMNGSSVTDETKLVPNAIITFRPVAGTKG